MKRALLAFVFLATYSTYSFAQTQWCIESGAEITDSVEVELTVSGQGGGTAQAIWEILAYRTTSGQVNYMIDPASISFKGDASVINALTTQQIFDLIGMATVSEGVAIGATPCPSSCLTPSYATVVQPSCVSRTGTGESTSFESCYSSGCCVRVYSVCCPNGQGMPQVVLISSQSPGCSGASGYGPGPCTSTCP